MGLTRDQIRKQLEGELQLCQSILLVSYKDAIREYKGGQSTCAVAWFNSDEEHVFSFAHIINCLYGIEVSIERYRRKFLASARSGNKISLPRVKRRMTMVAKKSRTNLAKTCKKFEGTGGMGGKKLIIQPGNHDVIFNLPGEKLKDWRGVKTSEMAMDHEGRRILKWVLTIDVDARAKKIIEDQVSDAIIMF